MNIKHKIGIGVLAMATFAGACTKNFSEYNTDPEVAPTLPPEYMITTSQKAMVDRDFEWFYDNYQYLMRWMQFTVAYPDGNTAGMYGPQNVNGYYSAFYTTIGRNLVEIEKMVGEMPAENQEQYRNLVAIAKVHKVFAAFRVTDVNGSIPYSEALSARGDANFTPVYDNQEKLFDQFDVELKAAVDSLLKSDAGQITYKGYDIFYDGDEAKWAKAANVLRLKIAMRLLKRSPEKLKTVATEVLASPAGLFASNADEWKFLSGGDGNFARGGNWNAQGNASRAGQNLIDFLQATADPRLALFFKKNEMTSANFNRLKNGGAFPSGAVYNPDQYVGVPSSPDAVNEPATRGLFGTKTYQITENGQSVSVSVDTLSQFQNRLFDLNADGNGAGSYTQPMLTYAEMCFMLSELAVRGIAGEDAQVWYENGIKASIEAYDAMGDAANIVDYAAVTPAAVTAYLAKPEIAFAGTVEAQLEKIGVQNFLNHFKSPWEAWGSWKRTGYPKVGGVLPLEAVRIDGAVPEIPRRWELPIPHTSNMSNYQNAISEMQAGGEYGTPNQLTGRVWWDKK